MLIYNMEINRCKLMTAITADLKLVGYGSKPIFKFKPLI